MDKIAQRRNILNKLHEGFNFPGRAAQKYFKPEFKRVMTQLIKQDDKIRSILLGRKVGDSQAPADKTEVKDLLKQAESFANRREYISAVTSLARFHKKFQEAKRAIEVLNLDVEKIHQQFLFGPKMPIKNYMDYFSDLEQRIAYQQVEIVKSAGVIDSLSNLFSERGRALKKWEKDNETRVGPLRDAVKQAIDDAKGMLSNVLSHLKSMASARASNNIEGYMAAAKEMGTIFDAYDKNFRSFYNSKIKPEVELQRKMQADRMKQEAEEIAKTQTPATPPPNQDEEIPIDLVKEKKVETPPILGDLPAPPTPNVSPVGPEPTSAPTPIPSLADETAKKLFGPPGGEEDASLYADDKRAHAAFLESLEAFAEESPQLLANYISKYAKSIQVKHPESALQLFKIAKNLRR